MRNVLIVSYAKILGGAESVLRDYLKNNESHRFYIYTSDYENVFQGYKNVIRNEKIFTEFAMRPLSIRNNLIKALFNISYNLYKINFIVKQNKIDILYGNNTLDSVFLVLYKMFLNENIKTILHVHDILERKLYINFIKIFHRYIDLFLVPSLAAKKSLGYFIKRPNDIFLVYNGINIKNNVKDVNIGSLKRKYNIPLEKKLICFIGQICKRKRPDVFVEILNGLCENSNDYMGVIVGSVSEEEIMNEISCKLNESIVYLGELDRKTIFSDIYPMLDMLILTSDRDPLPTVILEAMSCEKIVLAREVDGVVEIIKERENGFLFPYEFSVKSVVKKVMEIFKLSDKELLSIKENMFLTIKNKFNNEKKKKYVNNIIENL